MHADLSFEQAPPISVPFRFLLTAPLFGIAAGLLLAWAGESALATRWDATTLALTHLVTAGFMLQAMCGALLQFIPVAVGGDIRRSSLVVGLAHPLMVVGALSLVGGLLFGQPGLLVGAAVLLGLGLAVLLVPVLLALWQTPAKGSTVAALRIAAAGLVVTVSLGATLATGLGRGWALPYVSLTELHMAWGLGGWSLLLLAGVSFFVVPMFQLTPPYPKSFTRMFAPGVAVALLLASLLPAPGGSLLAGAVLAMAATSYAAVTLRLQGRRRRKITDTTYLFFRLAMASLLLAAASWLAGLLWPALGEEPRLPVWIGVLILCGGFLAAINGMMYKIVPFITWLHLQRACGPDRMPPSMKEMLSEARMRIQFKLYAAALAVLLLAVWVPMLARLAGLLLAASSLWLAINLAAATRRFAELLSRVRAGEPDRGS